MDGRPREAHGRGRDGQEGRDGGACVGTCQLACVACRGSYGQGTAAYPCRGIGCISPWRGVFAATVPCISWEEGWLCAISSQAAGETGGLI